jgi:cytochrome c
MLAVRAKSNGVEIEFTEPLKEGVGTNASDYTSRQWYYKPTAEYGGPKLDDHILQIKSVNVSADRKKVFLELAGMQAKHLVYIRLNRQTISSASGQNLWSTEAWYTMNNIPSEPGLLSKK